MAQTPSRGEKTFERYTKDRVPSVIRPGPAILASSRNQNVPAAAQQPATPKYATPSQKQSPQELDSTGGNKFLRQRQRLTGPRPFIATGYNSLTSPTLNLTQGDTRVPAWNTVQRRSSVEQSATMCRSRESIKTQIRDIQQMYQDWPTSPSGANGGAGGGGPDNHPNDDNNDKQQQQQQQSSHVVVIQEPDLVDLLSHGILALKPESKAPAWLLDVGPTSPCYEERAMSRLSQTANRRSAQVVDKIPFTPAPSTPELAPSPTLQSFDPRMKSQTMAPVQQQEQEEASSSADSGYCTARSTPRITIGSAASWRSQSDDPFLTEDEAWTWVTPSRLGRDEFLDWSVSSTCSDSAKYPSVQSQGEVRRRCSTPT